MGTRSTVKFYSNNQCILSVYQQYDGYVEGVGGQIAELLKTYDIVNGIPMGLEKKVANGIEELALFYVMDNKDGNGNIYATSADDSQEYNYEIHGKWDGRSAIGEIKVISEDEGTMFKGSPEEFVQFVEEY